MLHQSQIIAELGKMHQAGSLGNLELQFTSNAMTWFDDDLLRLIHGTKFTWLNYSIDAMGSLNDYIRSDSDWQRIGDTIDKALELRRAISNFGFGINICLSVLNANAMIDLVHWIYDKSPDIKIAVVNLVGPRMYDARNLPDDIKGRLIERYSSHIGAIPACDYIFTNLVSHLSHDGSLPAEEWMAKFTSVTSWLDGRRNADFKAANPELAGWLGYAN